MMKHDEKFLAAFFRDNFFDLTQIARSGKPFFLSNYLNLGTDSIDNAFLLFVLLRHRNAIVCIIMSMLY